jgi:hypothetical protein
MSRSATEDRMHNIEQATARIVERLIEETVAQAQAKVSPELAMLIGSDVAGLKDRVDLELNKLKGKAKTELDSLKQKAQGQLKEEADKLLKGGAQDLRKTFGGLLKDKN